VLWGVSVAIVDCCMIVLDSIVRMTFVICDLLNVVDPLVHVIISMYVVQGVVCSVQCYSVQCEVCSVQCVVCSVSVRMCSVCGV
jgi:hypothetical protein